MIYFDNSATTLIKPKEVRDLTMMSMTRFSANPGRSGHQASLNTATQVEYTREKIADFFELNSPNRVIFTENCSEALNLAILGSKKIGGHIVCTENEHNSVLRPLNELKEKFSIDFSIATQQEGAPGITLDDIIKKIQPNTYMIICNHISNVNGDKAQINQIGEYCKKNNILFLVDGAQSGGHEIISMKNIDMLALAPHKGFYSLQGLGVLLISDNVNLQPIKFGGTGTNSLELIQPEILPERFEVGTIPTPAILAFLGGLTFTENNFKSIQEKLEDMTTYLHYELSKLPVKIYTHPDNANGVLSFNLPSLHSNEVMTYLDQKYGICTRSGYHCAPKKHEALGTLDTGTVRVSLSFFNTIPELQKLIIAIKSLIKK